MYNLARWQTSKSKVPVCCVSRFYKLEIMEPDEVSDQLWNCIEGEHATPDLSEPRL